MVSHRDGYGHSRRRERNLILKVRIYCSYSNPCSRSGPACLGQGSADGQGFPKIVNAEAQVCLKRSECAGYKVQLRGRISCLGA